MSDPAASPAGTSPTRRLLLVAHGPTEDLRRARFGGTAPLSHPDLLLPAPARVLRWWCAPELACRETLARWGVDATPVTALAGPAAGVWRGRTLDDVAAEDPERAAAWIGDPCVAPPGGESLAALVDRVGAVLDDDPGPGWTGVIATPLVVRALLVAALGAPVALISRLDVVPGGRAELSRPDRQRHWHLRSLN